VPIRTRAPRRSAGRRRCRWSRWTATSSAAPTWSVGAGETMPGAFSKPSARSRTARSASRTTAKHLSRLSQETAELDGVIALATNAIAALNAEQHRQEKAVVGHDAQLQYAADEAARLKQKVEAVGVGAPPGRGRAPTPSIAARKSAGLPVASRRRPACGDERLTGAQRRLFESREATEELSHAPPRRARPMPRSSSAPWRCCRGPAAQEAADDLEVPRVVAGLRALRQSPPDRGTGTAISRSGSVNEEIGPRRSARPGSRCR